MYHAHYRSALTVRDRTAFVPWYSEFRYSHGKGRLLESACACGHASVSWPSGCGLRQSTLIHRSPVRRPVFLGGCARCRWQFDGYLPLRPGGGGGPRKIVDRAMKGEGFGGQQEFDYGVELHNWAQETISLLMKFEGGRSLVSGESKGHHNEFSLLSSDHNHADEYETSFKFGKCSFCEEANINVNGATENVDMVVEGRNRASSFRYLCDNKECEDDEFFQERGTMLYSHSSSLKRQQGKHELRHEFSLRGKHSASDPKETQKHDFTEKESTPPRARGRHRVTEDASDKDESTVGASSDGIARGKQHKFLRDGRYSNEERSKRQEISGDVQHFPKSDEIKGCLVDKQKKISSSSTLVSRHEEQISKRVDDSKVENRNVAGECSVSAGRCSSSYWAPQLHVDAKGKPRQRNEIRSSDSVTESVAVVSDARYASRKDQRVFVDETEEVSTSLDQRVFVDETEVSTSLHNSAGTSRQNKEKKVEGVAWNHVPQQTDSSVIILDSDMWRLHESKEYVDKNYRSSDIDYLQQTSTSRAHSSARLYQDQISVQKMPTTSSSEPPIGISLNISSGHQTAEYTASDYISQYQHHSNINYTQELSSNSMQTGARISEALRLQDQPRSHPSQCATKISMDNTRAHQSDGYTTRQTRHDLEYHQESRDNNTRIGATDSGQADQPEISVLSYPQSVNTGSLSGSSGYQLAGYASNDDISKHRSSVNVNYNDTQIDTILSGQIILHEQPADLSSPYTLYGSPRTAGEHQPTGSSTNKPLQINSDVIHVGQQGEVPPDHPEPNDIVKQCSEPPTESGCSRPIILLEKSSDGSRHPSTGNLHPANLPSEIIVEETEKTYIVERERSSNQTTTSFQQLVLINPPPNSNADTVQGNSRKNVFEDSGMQRSRQSSVLSEADEQSDEIWAVARETLEEHSNMDKSPKTMITPVTSGSGAQLTEVTSTVGTTEGTEAASLGNPTAKRPSRKHWGYVAEIIKSGWILRAGTHNSKSKSVAKSSLTESGSNEAWFSGHEPVGEESPRKEKEVMLEEPGGDEGSADALISEASASANNRQDITDDRNSRSMLADNKPDTSSPIGLSAHVSIQEEASSISDSQMLGSATNYASIGSLSVSVSGTVSPAVIACSTGIHDVQQQEKNSVLPVISPKVGRKNLDSGSHEPSIQDRPEKDASNEDKKRALGSRKLRRAAQVQRERFEAWEDTYRLENEQRKMDEMFMREAIAEARKAADIWEVPVGAVLVQDGKIIARGHNLVEELRDSTAHAEMLCIRGASRMLRTWRLAETTLYVTLEPCPMCAGAILQARIGTLVWGAPNKLLGADGSWVRLFPSVDQGQDSLDQGSHSAGPVHHIFRANTREKREKMASSSWPSLLLLLCMVTTFTINVHADQMAIYWGAHMKNLNNADLKATCQTKHFSHVSLAFLTNFGNGRTPRPDFGTVCDAQTDGCKSLEEDINVCQQLGVKVLLSIGGLDENKYTLESAQEANQLAAHIYDVYMSGNGVDGPLGKVKLDGVDFYVNDASSSAYWDILARGLKQLDENMILTASQGCNHTTGQADIPLYNALKTRLFSKVWPRFYGQPCTYQPRDTAAFRASVQSWATEFNDMDIYLGILANPDSEEERFISPRELPGALKIGRQHENFRGVMLWNRYLDVKFLEDGNRAPYSDIIYGIVNPSSNNRMRAGF